MSRGVQIHRWADAPNELRRQVDPARRSRFDWLAVVPSHRRGEDLGVRWEGIEQVELEDGTLLIAGREEGRNGA